jgi:ferrochelatase
MSGFLSSQRLSAKGATRTAIAVLNFGGPIGAADVEPFLFELFNDPDVIQLPVGPSVRRAIARRVSTTRAPKVVPQYAAIGGSPIVPMTMTQVEALRAELERKLGREPPPIHVGMRYTEPSIRAMVETIAKAPPDRLIALALYPHYSGTTTGSSFNALALELKAKDLDRLPVHYVPAFYDHPRYLAALAERIQHATAKASAEPHLLFSAHGLPSSYVRAGDPYQAQVQETVRLMVGRLGWTGSFGLAYQSKVGPVRWLKPSTEEEIDRLARAGTKEIVIVPVSFVSDHIETLYEIDVTFREFAEARGVKLIRTAALDAQPDFIGCLAEVLLAALEDDRYQGLGGHRCVRCLHPKPHEHRMRSLCVDCGHATPSYLMHLPPVREP